MTTQQTSGLDSRVVLVRLQLSTWNAQKVDRRADKAVRSEFGGDGTRMGTYRKDLIDMGRVKRVKSIASACRDYHYSVTLPWLDEGLRILPTDLYLEYSEQMRQYKAQIMAEAAALVADLDQLKRQAQTRLGDLFNASDYPSDLINQFGMYLTIMPLPASADIRLDLPDKEVRKIEAALKADIMGAQEAAMGTAWERLHGVVANMAERLGAERTDKKGEKTSPIFRDSLVSNVRELVRIMPALNISNDADLDTLVKEIDEKLTGHDPAVLRANESARKETADAAADIVSKMSAFM